MQKKSCDFVIAGGGIIGLGLARALATQYPDSTIRVLEKETKVGEHTSGRNSGVLHAGFYYQTDSVKARFCRQGCAEWTQFCLEHKIRIKQCGKLVTARNPEEMPYLHKLYKQGLTNGVELELISRDDAVKIEPTLAGFGDQVIFSPSTCVMDIHQAMQRVESILPSNVTLHKNAELLGIDSSGGTSATCTVKNDGVQEQFEAKMMINAAGLHALNIAHSQGLATDYTMLPIKGRYAISKDAAMADKYQTLVYPVPVDGNFALGVHSTLAVDGHVKLGPTVFPAFSPENYEYTDGLNARDLLSSLRGYTRVLQSTKARGLAKLFLTKELRKSLSIEQLVKEAQGFQSLGDGTASEIAKQFQFYRAGIRSQLFNMREGDLLNDFLIERDESGTQLHVLNVVSPGWTCSMPFTRWIVDEKITPSL